MAATARPVTGDTVIDVTDLTMGYPGKKPLMEHLTFSVRRGDIFFITGGSGCGKSTLLSVLRGQLRPRGGTVTFSGEPFWPGSDEDRLAVRRRTGVLFQQGALWSSMTLAQNIAVPLELYTDLSQADIRRQAELKLALAGLRGCEDYYPSEISGGMRKRAALARALALDPEILFLDEPSAGLDPVSSKLLDDLIVELQEGFGTTFVIVSHELASIYSIATNIIYLDAPSRSLKAWGAPDSLAADPATDRAVIEFLTRGRETTGGAGTANLPKGIR